MLIFYTSKWRYCRHWKTWWNMFVYFCWRWILSIIFTSTNLVYHTFKIWINNKWYFIRFCNWLNSNALVSSEGITTLQKSLFLHTFLCNSSWFCCKRMKKSPWSLGYILLLILLSFFIARLCHRCPLDLARVDRLARIVKVSNYKIIGHMHLSLFGIIKRITCFLRFGLCFET